MPRRSRQQMIVMSAFGASMTMLPLLAKRKDRLACETPFDWARLALATYAISRIVAREKVGSFIRDPLIEAAEAVEAQLDSDPHGDVHQPWAAAFAELVTCTRCVGVWNAALLTYLKVLSPAHGRVAVEVLSVAGANNFLQAGFSKLAAQANVDETRERLLRDREGAPSPQNGSSARTAGSARR